MPTASRGHLVLKAQVLARSRHAAYPLRRWAASVEACAGHLGKLTDDTLLGYRAI